MPKSILLSALLALPLCAAGEELLDPTRPLLNTPRPVLQKTVKSTQPRVPLRLDAITYARQPNSNVTQGQRAKAGHSAIINGVRVSSGERIHGARVVSIHPSRVQLARDGRRITLEWAAPLRKRSRQP